MKLLSYIDGYKSHIVAAATIFYAVVVVGWQAGDWQQANLLVLGALGFSAGRDAIKKLEK